MRIPVSEPLLDGNEREYVLEALDTNWISSAGKYIPAFEESFAEFCGVKYGVACSSGTAAIHLALAALGIGPGDEVIIPDFTLIASANMVILTGARPVLVDVDPYTFCIDPALIEEKITQRTRAIMPVHMYGHPCDMDAIMEIAEVHGLYVIEDGAEAHGTEYKGRMVGGLGHAAAFSFYGNKNLTTGEGGMVTTNSADLAEMTALLRSQAFEEPRFVHRFVGFNYRLTNIQAAIGLAQVENAAAKVARRRKIAATYNSLLSGVPGLTLPYEAEWAKNTYWMYGLLVDEREFGRSKTGVVAGLNAAGVETRDFFYPMHQQPVFNDSGDARFPDCRGEYPVSTELYENGFYLPSGLTLTTEQIEIVVDTLLSLRR
ncbi:MAG TPA: DegT/DnrJ/EryC1/StrS family aminotransferase [Aggregatilineales bacterium]|nr:DegT/DnrJ/EryC1/StrS family aminotransferase [Aggregatilineales bacterium]